MKHTKTMPFVATHSVLESFAGCPRKFQAQYVTKEISYKPSEAADLGKCVHKLAEWYAMYNAVGDCPVLEDILETVLSDSTYKAIISEVKPTFPPAYAALRAHWSNVLMVLEKLPWSTRGAKFFTEYKCAIHRDGNKCNYYDKDGAFRSIIDLLVISGPIAIVIDWKTGKELKPSLQLTRAAPVVFANFPEVQVVHTAFVSSRGHPSIKDGIARESMADIMAEIVESTAEINMAYATDTWPEIKTGLCKSWCAVKNCVNFGDGANVL